MNHKNWSSQQVIGKKELHYLAKDLLDLLSILEDKHLDTTAGMINTILNNTILTGITIDTSGNILINHERE